MNSLTKRLIETLTIVLRINNLFKSKRKENKRGRTMKNAISSSFLRGYFRVFNLNGAKKWPNLSADKRKDYEAIRSDWENVGKSIREGTKEFRESNR